ncbi:unnamed protein product [Sympodiomycopsis kandeliae]
MAASFLDSSPASISYSHLESETDFYAQVDLILDSPLRVPTAFQEDQDGETRTHVAVFDKLQSFLHLLEGCYDRFLQRRYNLEYCIQRLMHTPLVVEQRKEMGICIVDLSHRATTLQGLLVSYDLILAFGLVDSSIYTSLHGDTTSARDKITRLVHQIWAGHYAAQADERLGSNQDLEAGQEAGQEAGWVGAYSHQDNTETTLGHPMSQRIRSQPHAETSNAARFRLHQIRLREKAIQLLYEASRVQRLEPVDMRAIDSKFISHLFDLVELTRSHEDERFNYMLIKLIVALNEQFMVTAISTTTSGKNTVMSVLKSRLHVTKTFGENLIFMLNRASSNSAEDHCMQLLVLKLLYLLFTSKETAHYFYTNDLKVLVDVFIRELSDLPEDNDSLRHTYLRVLHPLLTSTQLCGIPYKRPQIRRLLKMMTKESLYRGDISVTTRRLVQRCLDAEWCKELDRLDPDYKPTTTAGSNGVPVTAPSERTSTQLDLDRPSTLLDAPRFRAVSARSAPNTPPPPTTTTSTSTASSASVTGEEEAAMALADAMTNTERESEPSWQSQIANSNDSAVAGHLDQNPSSASLPVGADQDHIPSVGSVGSRSEFLPTPSRQHRPIPRRASHNEFSKNTTSSSSTSGSSSRRRAPPAPPTPVLGHSGNGGLHSHSAAQNGSGSNMQNGNGSLEFSIHAHFPGQNGNGYDAETTLLPSVRVQEPSTGQDDDDEDTPALFDDKTRAARILTARQIDQDLLAGSRIHRSLSSSPRDSTDSEADMDRMTQSLTNLSSDDDLVRSSAGKQRRRPPAPPCLSASEYKSDIVTVQDDEPGSTGGSVTRRRRPPPPPVNRATKADVNWSG